MAFGSFNDLDSAQQQEDLQLGPAFGYDFNRVSPIIQRQQDAFTQTFQNLMGRQPTSDEVNNYFQQQYLGQQHPDLLDPYSTAQAYTTNAYGPQIADYNKQQQQTALQQSQSSVNDVVNQTMGNVSKQFADPNSSIYQGFSGSMNNLGITPGSGAFESGAGSTIANAGLTAANQGLSSISFPQISNMAGTGNNPYQQAIGAPGQYSSSTGSMNDFALQEELARALSGGGGSNTLGNVAALLQGGGAAAGGGAQAYKATWICTAMREEGVLAPSEVYRLHNHLFPSLFRRWWKFLGYFMFGKLLVLLANRSGVDWYSWRPMFYDRVIAEPDSLNALGLYEDAFWSLVKDVRLRFRIKTMLFYDKPTEVRR